MKIATSKARYKKCRDCVKVLTRSVYVWCKEKHFAKKRKWRSCSLETNYSTRHLININMNDNQADLYLQQ